MTRFERSCQRYKSACDSQLALRLRTKGSRGRAGALRISAIVRAIATGDWSVNDKRAYPLYGQRGAVDARTAAAPTSLAVPIRLPGHRIAKHVRAMDFLCDAFAYTNSRRLQCRASQDLSAPADRDDL